MARQSPALADENPTEVMPDAGPDAELLATAAAAAQRSIGSQARAPAMDASPAVQVAPNSSDARPLSSLPQQPPQPAPQPQAMVPPQAPAAAAPAPSFGAPSPESLRPPPRPRHDPLATDPDTLVKAPPLRAHPDVTAPHRLVPRPPPAPSQTPIFIAVAIGVIVGLGGAIAVLMLKQ